MKSFIITILAALFLSSNLSAQSLADVLSSIQERKQVLEQRSQVAWYLTDTYGSFSPSIMPELNLIEWEGLTGIQFPTDSDTAGLGMDARISLLNQAIDQLRYYIQRRFLNLRKEDMTTDAKIGALRSYLLEDYADSGRVGAENYHTALAEVAASVRRLSVVTWPLAGRKRQLLAEIAQNPASESSLPNEIGPGPIGPNDDGGVWGFNTNEPMIEDCNLSGAFSSEGDGSWSVTKQELYYDQIALYAGVAEAAGQPAQLDGKLAVVVRNHWSPVPENTVNVQAPTSWDSRDGAYQVAMVKDSAAGEYSMGAAPQVTVQLSWVTSGGSGVTSWVYPTGYNVISPGGLFANDTWEYQLAVWNGFSGLDGYYVMGRRLDAVFAPTFTKGLDAPGKAEWLDKSERASRATAGDAKPMLHPSPGLLAAIPLGSGLDGNIDGFIGITVSDGNLIRHTSQTLGSVMPESDVGPTLWELHSRLDYAASLRFIGSVQDFHVVYETSREAADRGTTLPSLKPTSQEQIDMGYADVGCELFFRNWDLPRLKQVVSRDFIVNIEPQGHYKNEVKIYRRPADAGAVDRTPGELVDVGDSAVPIRTLIFENPDANNQPYLDTPEKLHITDGNTIYKVWRDGYPTWDYDSNGYAAGTFPDLHFEVTEGTAIRYAKFMDFDGIGEVTTTTTMDGAVMSVESISDESWYWFTSKQPASRIITRGAQTTEIANTFDPNFPNGAQYDWYPETSHITTTNEPDIDLAWSTSGRLTSMVQGDWSTEYSISSDTLETESKFKTDRYATTWTEWSGKDTIIKTYSAPDGSISVKGDSRVAWTQIELGDASGNGLPGLPHTRTSADGNGASWDWTVSADGSGSLTVESGQFAGSTLSTGQRQISAWNQRGYAESSSTQLVAGGTTTVTDFAVPTSQSTTWGAPKEWKNLHTGLSSQFDYDGSLNRLTSATSPLGLSTDYSNYDVFDRAGQIGSNGITANHTYAGLNVSSTFSGNGIGAGAQSSTTQNAEGTISSKDLTWGGVEQSVDVNRGASSTSVISNHDLLGSSTTTRRKDDGSLSAADGSTMAFDGVTGDALTITGGLFVRKSQVASLTASFAETHTDAWGRTHKIVSPSTTGSGSTQISFDYSLPSDALKRIITTQPSGRILITESEASGTINRSGIDMNNNGVLDPTDRYTESITTVVGGKVVTTLSVNGSGEVLRSELTPSTGVTVTKINGNEETITNTPNYTTKSVKSTSTKGWERTTAINALGKAASNTLAGTGIPTTSLTPAWRADGSLDNISLNIGGAVSDASFNLDGTLAGLTDPVLGPLPVSHGYANGIETLTVNGTTATSSLDGTASSLSGAGVMERSRSTAISNGEFQETIDPAEGSSTVLASNPAGAKVKHQYAAGESPEMTWFPGGLLESVSRGRGGAVNYGYSDDGAKDLISYDWPAVTSPGFPGESFYGSVGFTQRDNAGNITAMSGPSGNNRTLVYDKNRLISEAWPSGSALGNYEVQRLYDGNGRLDTVTLKRNGTNIHSIDLIQNGQSHEITDLTASGFSASILRDANSRIVTGSNRPGGVTQTWARTPAGRITAAGSSIAGAPSFTYNSFDSQGRRESMGTNHGTWNYDYKGGDNGDGQLESASNNTINASFAYSFDGIGRRVDFAGNAANPLNQMVANQRPLTPRNLYIAAEPGARLWVNGAEMTPFDGGLTYPLAHPGNAGGWVDWAAKGVLEGAGEAGANPDAVAEINGTVYFPPTAESFTFDDDGNRESSTKWDYGWDGRNRMVRARTKDWDTAPAGWNLSFEYDAEGRRFKKEVTRYEDGVVVEEKIIHFVWDGWDLLYERHEDGGGAFLMDRKYVWGPDILDGAAGGAGGLLLIREKHGAAQEKDYYPVYDGSGHVVGLSDTSGKLVAEYWWGPFGELIEAKGEMADANPWRYATKYFDVETGLYYFGFRYFDPTSGQWLSREPLGESESLNLYAYCHNDPVNKVDILGLAEASVIYEKYGTNDLALINRMNQSKGGPFYVNVGGSIVQPCNICHGRTGGRIVPGLNSFYSSVNGRSYSSDSPWDRDKKVLAGLWGEAKATPKHIGNIGITLKNMVTLQNPFSANNYFDAKGTYQSGVSDVYPGLSGDDLLAKGGSGVFVATTTFIAPQGILWKGASFLRIPAMIARPLQVAKVSMHLRYGKLASQTLTRADEVSILKHIRGLGAAPNKGAITDPSRLLPAPRGANPDLAGAPIIGVELPKGYRFNQAVGPGQTSPGAFGTLDNIPSVDFVRNNLAVIPAWKPVVSGSRSVQVTRPVRAQWSRIGPQTADGVTYPGGGWQLRILEYDPKNPFVQFLGKEIPLR